MTHTNRPPRPPSLTDDDYIRAAKSLKCDVSSIRAAADVESDGGGFIFYDKKNEWRPKILFERHVMYRRYKQYNGYDKAIAKVRHHPDIINTRPGGYQGGDAEHDRLGKARLLIHKNLALESASWGMFQIMGYHWQSLGYKSVVDFVLKMSESEANQLDAFVKFIKNNTNLLNAIRSKDWQLFARSYNGKAYAKNKYDIRMRQAEKDWRAQGVNDVKPPVTALPTAPTTSEPTTPVATTDNTPILVDGSSVTIRPVCPSDCPCACHTDVNLTT